MPDTPPLPFKIPPSELSLMQRFVLRELWRMMDKMLDSFHRPGAGAMAGATASDLTERLALSPEEASNSLKELADLGYLEPNDARRRGQPPRDNCFQLVDEAFYIVGNGFRVEGVEDVIADVQGFHEYMKTHPPEYFRQLGNRETGPDPLGL